MQFSSHGRKKLLFLCFAMRICIVLTLLLLVVPLIHNSAFDMFLVHYYLDDICEAGQQRSSTKVFGKQYKVLNFLLGPCGRSFGKKTFVLCVLWSGFKRDQVEFVMNAF